MTIEEIYSVIDEATHLTFDFLLNTFYAAMIAAVCTPHTNCSCSASKACNNITFGCDCASFRLDLQATRHQLWWRRCLFHHSWVPLWDSPSALRCASTAVSHSISLTDSDCLSLTPCALIDTHTFAVCLQVRDWVFVCRCAKNLCCGALVTVGTGMLVGAVVAMFYGP